MRTLIIPDIHNHTAHADYWIGELNPDRVIFLGDYFDDFHDTPEDARATAGWLRRTVEAHPDWTFLLGNHDMAYLFPFDDRFLVPGFTEAKQAAIAKEIRGMDRTRFKVHTWLEKDILVSHAGLQEGWLPTPRRTAADELLEEVANSILHGKWHSLLSWGQDRGGMSWQPSVGGVIWMDWSSFKPLPFCHQIVGHTPARHVRHRTWDGRVNICLDVGNGAASALVTSQPDGSKSIEAFTRSASGPERVLFLEMR